MNSAGYNAQVRNGQMCVILIAVITIALLVLNILALVLMNQAYGIEGDDINISEAFYLFLASSYNLIILFYRWYSGKRRAKLFLLFFISVCIMLNAYALYSILKNPIWSFYTEIICLNIIILFIILLLLFVVRDIDKFMANQKEINDGIIVKGKKYRIEYTKKVIMQIQNGKLFLFTTMLIYIFLGLGTMGETIKNYIYALSNKEIEVQDIVLYITKMIFLFIIFSAVYYIVLKGNMWAKAIIIVMIFYEVIMYGIAIIQNYLVYQSNDAIYLDFAYFIFYFVIGMFVIMSKNINLYIDNYKEVIGVNMRRDYETLVSQIERILHQLSKRIDKEPNSRALLLLFERYSQAKEILIRNGEINDIIINGSCNTYLEHYNDYGSQILIDMEKAEEMLENIICTLRFEKKSY